LIEFPKKMAWIAGSHPARKLKINPVVILMCSSVFISHPNLISAQVLSSVCVGLLDVSTTNSGVDVNFPFRQGLSPSSTTSSLTFSSSL
jgi:hypothetical protein